MRVAGRVRRDVIVAAIVAVVVAVVAGALLAETLRDSGDDPGFGDVTSGFDRFPDSNAGHGPGATVPGAPDAGSDLVAFGDFVFDDVQGFWREEFARAGLPYRPATMVLFRRATPSGCGLASSETGPFYCPIDERVYLDLTFFHAARGRVPRAGRLRAGVRHRARGRAPRADARRRDAGGPGRAGAEPAARERGVDTPRAAGRLPRRRVGALDATSGACSSAATSRRRLNAAAAVGDDRIQRRTTGRIQPERWTHGSSEQRRRWLLRGFEGGDAAACQTFAGGGVNPPAGRSKPSASALAVR